MNRALPVVILAAALSGRAAAESVDRVVAVVGETPILESEVHAEVEVLGLDASFGELSPPELRSLALDKLVENRLLVAKARSEGIVPSEEEIDEALEGTIERMRARFPGEAEFLAALEEEGVTIEEVRRRYRKELESSLTARTVVEREMRGKTAVSEADLRRFYDGHRDDLPLFPERVELAQIFIEPRGGGEAGDSAVAALEELRRRVLAGEDFGELARVNSEGPSASFGGDLGFFGRGEMDSDFEKAAFALAEPGELSEVVRTRFGFHLIQLVERNGERIRARHILKRVAAGEGDREEARRRADAIADSLEAGGDFDRLARRRSDDPESGARGGGVGVFALDDLAAEVREILAPLAPGEVSEVVEAPDGYHIFKILARYAEGKPSFDEAREELRQAVRQERQQEIYQDLVERLRGEVYVRLLGDSTGSP